MLWLFAEIWLWLLSAFVLGIGLTALTLWLSRRRNRAADAETTDWLAPVFSPPGSPGTGALETGSPAPSGHDVSAAERTQFISRVSDDTGDYAGYGAEDDTDEIPDEGYWQGTLPGSPSEWHVRNEWPDERDITVAEENRPRRKE